MTTLQKLHGPFAQACPKYWPVPYIVTCDAGDRLKLVRASTDAEWLEAVIKSRSTQKTVRAAAKRRLRWVNAPHEPQQPGK